MENLQFEKGNLLQFEKNVMLFLKNRNCIEKIRTGYLDNSFYYYNPQTKEAYYISFINQNFRKADFTGVMKSFSHYKSENVVF